MTGGLFITGTDTGIGIAWAKADAPQWGPGALGLG